MSDRIIFLGTAGARFVVTSQIRASGGMWFTLEGTNLYLDPGPGALVKCRSKREKLDPAKLDGIILSHRHLDHSSDVNIMIEAMTKGGFERRGKIFAPVQALEDDPVILRYVRDYVEEVVTLREGGSYQVGEVEFTTPIRHIHGNAETYGVNFRSPSFTISYITDTKFFPELIGHYRGKFLIINVVRLKPSDLDHLCLEDAERIINEVQPRLAVLTHFGMTMIRAKPWELAADLSQRTGVEVIAARDGMIIELEKWKEEGD